MYPVRVCRFVPQMRWDKPFSRIPIVSTTPAGSKSMDLLTKLQDDMKAAMKSGQKDRLQVIRMLISDVKIIDLDPRKPTAEQAVEAYGKKLRKSLEEYERINQSAAAAKLREEIAVVDEYLPKKASAADTERLVDEFVAANNF